MQQFAKENAHIVMSLSAMEDLEAVSEQLRSSRNIIDYAKLSREKIHIYNFIKRSAEYEDDDILTTEQYIMTFTATGKLLQIQTNIVQVVADYLINLCAAHQIVK